MLDRLVVHLKNIIFFKAVIYSIILIVLFFLIPIFQESLVKAERKKIKSEKFLQATTLKMDSIIDFEDKIFSANKRYKKLMDGDDTECINRNLIIENISFLTQIHQLFEPIQTRIYRVFDVEKTPNTNGHIKMHYYEVDIKFKVSDYYSLLMIYKDLQRILPQESLVTSLKVYSINALTPKIASALSKDKAPGLIGVKMKAQLKEIVYEK